MPSVAASFSLLLAALVGGVGCERRALPDQPARAEVVPQDSLTRLIQALRTMPGRFVRVRANPQVFSFDGDRALVGAIARFGDSAVVRLVDCLDNMEAASATLADTRVPTAAMCMMALAATASYEATDVRGDLVGWEGYVVDPLAPASTYAAAKQAWREVVRNRAYQLL